MDHNNQIDLIDFIELIDHNNQIYLIYLID